MATPDLITVFEGTPTGPRILGTLDVPHPKPLHFVTYSDELPARDFTAAAGPVAPYVGRSIVLANDFSLGGYCRPMLLVPRPDRIDLLPASGCDTWRTMALALERWAPGRTRRSFQGPHIAGLEWDPSPTVRTVLTGPSGDGMIERAGHPRDWPPELLRFVFTGVERVALDPDPPTGSPWRGRPAEGRSYVRIIAAPSTFSAWRRIARDYSPNVRAVHLSARRRRGMGNQ